MSNKKNFHIIRHKGDPRRAKTAGGQTIERKEQLLVPEWNTFVKCAPYDNHFIYENPDLTPGSHAYLCTCGSMAVVVPPGPHGMFVCHFHATYQQHQTSVIDKKDFGKSAGQTVRVKKAKKWE